MSDFISSFNKSVPIHSRRLEQDAIQGKREARSQAYGPIRRASTGAFNAVSRLKQRWAAGFARWQRAVVKPVWAHCDLPCGVYDPEQARIEAKSILGINTKYPDLSEEDKWRAVRIKEDRAELVKHHLWVLWTDYFKPEHLEKHPNLHDLFWQATKQAGQVKKSTDIEQANKLLELIDDIDAIFKETKK